MIIPFNKPPKAVKSGEYLLDVLENCKYSGDGEYTKKCADWVEKLIQVNGDAVGKALVTTSGSHALDMSACLCGIKTGDEVIMPSYTFSSTANAYASCGAKIVFVDIRPDTMNLDESLIEAAITPKTKAIVPVHYAGVSCEMDAVSSVAQKHGLWLIEDAAQAFMSKYKGRPCGGMSDFGCFSFHETKNFSMGEGGALVIKDNKNIEKAEIIREKGTNRSKFYRGEVDKYSWVDIGSSYLPSEFLCAYLWSQLEVAGEITRDRLRSWELYYQSLRELGSYGKDLIELPYIPEDCEQNGHMFYIKVKNMEERDNMLAYLKGYGIGAVFHYIPLHSAPAGLEYGRFSGEDRHTTKESRRLIRLPMFFGLKEGEIGYITEKIKLFYS